MLKQLEERVGITFRQCLLVMVDELRRVDFKIVGWHRHGFQLTPPVLLLLFAFCPEQEDLVSEEYSKGLLEVFGQVA